MTKPGGSVKMTNPVKMTKPGGLCGWRLVALLDDRRLGRGRSRRGGGFGDFHQGASRDFHQRGRSRRLRSLRRGGWVRAGLSLVVARGAALDELSQLKTALKEILK
jgi:hypothetical protein